MRRSREDAARTRRSIVETASRLIRRQGIGAVSVADILGELGLTVGGFYRHFADKEALIAEAIEAASLETTDQHRGRATGQPQPALARALIEGYLSPGHRDHPEAGCPVAALCSEVAHEGELAKEAFGKAFGRLLEISALLIPGSSPAARDLRLQTAAAIVGALVLSRAVPDARLADEILAAVRRDVLARLDAWKETA
jgi:TetR/AcrR family transcriptional repressor of nem operon